MMETLQSVNECQLLEMRKAAETLDPTVHNSCIEFGRHIRNVQAAIIHSYQIVAHSAIRESDPREAANHWQWMTNLCDTALEILKELKDVYPHCGTPELYDLVLDYRSAAYRRYTDNLQDAECQSSEIPVGLFPKTN